ncbi:MAG TPA: hypothetical protein ENO12_00370, partial [Thermoplasmatales archaeon]|nr:hypothetical protein [Thermoplasmatales archaeon]
MKRKCLAIGMLFLFLLVSIVPFIQGESNEVIDEFIVNEDFYQYMTDWSVHPTDETTSEETSRFCGTVESYDDAEMSPLDGPMDSPWPMFGHDVVHTGRSSYSTVNNSGAELWRIRGSYPGVVWSSPVIDQNNIIYFGT